MKLLHDYRLEPLEICRFLPSRFSEADGGSEFVRLADERVALNGSAADQTYLNQELMILSAIKTGANAIHPGYGFLSENSDFAKKVEDQNLIFIGPSSNSIFEMGDKLRARAIAKHCNLPILEGIEFSDNLKEVQKFCKNIGYPVIVKALFWR